jgi:ABC-type polysaccharide/polyol phosphate export permease
VLALRETSLLIDLASLGLLMASGVMFPISVLPVAAQVLVMALPTTLAPDILRVYALGTPSLLPLPAEYGLMAAGALLTLLAGHVVFQRTVRRTLTRGTLGFH